MKPYLLIINDLENIMFELSVTVELLIVCISRKRLERFLIKLVASVKRAMKCVGVFSCLIHDADATSTYHQPRSK